LGENAKKKSFFLSFWCVLNVFSIGFGGEKMSKRLSDDCAQCPLAAKVAALEQLVARQQEQLTRQDEVIARQQETISRQEEEIARLKTNSRTSSKPPSSDIVKPPAPKLPGGKKRKIGGQPGHEKNERAPFAPEDVDEIKPLELAVCPACGGPVTLRKSLAPTVQQTVEFPEKPLIVTEYRRPFYWCPSCQAFHQAPLPNGVVEGQLFGQRLVALTAMMKGALHTSYRCLQAFFADALDIEVSTGHFARTVARVSEALAAPYEELKEQVPSEPVLHVDETGFKENGKKRWIWVFACQVWSFFAVAAHRSREVLLSVLTDAFSGVIVSDFYPAYLEVADARHQFCLAHLIRDVKFLTTLASETSIRCGERLLRAFRRLFAVWHDRDRWRRKPFERELYRIRVRIRNAISDPQLTGEGKRLARRIAKNWNSLFLFLEEPGVPPTNNEAERPLRFPAIDRRMTQGCRGETGARWSERIWTVLDTCAKQKRSAWQFLLDCLDARATGAAYPSLLPTKV
jgi:transposase